MIPVKASILIDENNAVSQLHVLGIEGIRPWKQFYEALHDVLNMEYQTCEVDYRFYGAIPPMKVDKHRHHLRKRFFQALNRDGILTRTGYCQVLNGNLKEKEVDMLIGFDLYDLSRDKYNLLLVFSADGDFGPAIQRAQSNGSKVVAILSEQQPAERLRELVDGVIPVEAVLDLIDDQHLIRRTNTKIS